LPYPVQQGRRHPLYGRANGGNPYR
jgi:hypothetical protein